MIESEVTAVKAYCNVLALEKGLNPAGHAGHFEGAIVIETPLPWKKNMYRESGALPQEALDLLALWLKRYEEGLGYPHRPLMIAPDPAYSRLGVWRVMFYTRQPGAFAQFDKVEYLVPQAEVGPLLWALYEARDDLPRFEKYRVPEADSIRELLVCTHGTIDAACAKFGYPLYHYLRRNFANESVRVWRVSHFGGHVFAPTMMDMPTGHYWAYVEEPQARQIVRREGDVAALYSHYRGWAGCEHGFMQVAEGALWQQEGWAWFGYPRSGEILAQDAADEPQWAEVAITFSTSDSFVRQTWLARVEVERSIETISTTGYTHTHAYPQYVVTRLEKMQGAEG